jgi:hypothetical protein
MCALADHPAKPSVVLDRELDEKKGHDPSGPRIRCPLCGWSPRKDDRWSRELGGLRLQSGFYAYVSSALARGGVRARLAGAAFLLGKGSALGYGRLSRSCPFPRHKMTLGIWSRGPLWVYRWVERCEQANVHGNPSYLSEGMKNKLSMFKLPPPVQ